MRIEDYLHLVTSQIRCKKACPCVEKELENHIMDQMNAYVKEGMDEETALDKAILEMGDPVEVGVFGGNSGNRQCPVTVCPERSRK